MAIGEGSKVEAFAGAQGYCDAVVIVGVVVNQFAFAGNGTVFYGIHVSPEVADVPATIVAVVAVGGGAEANVRDILPVA